MDTARKFIAGVLVSILMLGVPLPVLSDYQRSTSPLDMPREAMVEARDELALKIPIEEKADRLDSFVAGEWDFEDPTGETLHLVIAEVPPASSGSEWLQNFDPEQMAIELGVQYIGESKLAPEGCRMFTYSAWVLAAFIAMCENDSFAMYVLGTDYEDTKFVAESFMNNESVLVPNSYREVD